MDPAASLPARIGIVGGMGEDGLEHVRIDPYPELLRHGVVRIAVWTLMADMLGGWVADCHADHDWVFTTDLSIRFPVRPTPASVVATARPLRIGRNTVVADVEMRDETGAVAGYSQVGFIRMPRRHGDDPKPDFANAAASWVTRPRITDHLDTEAGIQVVDASRGIVEVELRDTLRNPAGAMQGAMVALVGEVAAEELASFHLGGPHVVTDLDVRYLAMGRVGPVRADAHFVGPPESGTIRIELRDLGNEGRLMTALLARVAPLPG
jgi:acyl-coenzyme A thioesterase PaaI-like protein